MSWMDLHCHSLLSDGSFTVREVIKAASDRGLTAVSLTDHDTVDGTEEALMWGLTYGITVIPGIEISAYDFSRNRKIHLLGYNYSCEPRHIKKLCTPLIKARNDDTVEKIRVLEKAGYPVTEEEVRKIAGNAPALYKQHIMQLFIQKGLTHRIYSDLYRELFKNKGICSGDIRYIDIYDAIDAVRRDGGYPVLAHPGFQDVYDLIPRMVEKGLWGIELHHEENTLKDRILIKEFAKTYNLVMTGGSDSHGSFGSEHDIGDITAPPSCRIPGNGEENIRKKTARALIEKGSVFLKSSLHDDKNLTLKQNNPADLVTLFDRKVEEILISGLKEHFPSDTFLSEEDDSCRELAACGYTWIIDPIDGTTNFVQRQKDFSISLACYRDGVPWFGMVQDVVENNLYEAETGHGARLNGMTLPVKSSPVLLEQSLADLSLHTVTSLEETLKRKELTARLRGHRAFGCASLILCQIAVGTTDLYLSSKLHIWDFAAGQIILNECGGSHLTGEKNNPEEKDRSNMLYLAAATGNLLDQAAEYIDVRFDIRSRRMR